MLIYFADDHKLVALGIQNLLVSVPGVNEVRHFLNGKSLILACRSIKPTAVFLDIEMPEMNGFETLEQLRAEGFDIPIIMLSMLDEKSVIDKCLELGADGYLFKNCEEKDLHNAIACVQMGAQYFSEVAKQRIKGEKSPLIIDKIEYPALSNREMEVLKLLCDGFGVKEIAERLFLSNRTIETHKTNIMKKMDVNNTVKLVSIAIKHGIIK
ncbi:MAG: response regulator transcription factor [Bacteroidia bacterium]|nr:response regulator transcription factor [Bacteroidia bacterium]